MSEVRVQNEVDVEQGYFIEGVPGVGLASKIATDHVIDRLDMTLHATVKADGLPEVMIFQEGERGLRPPVRIFVDEDTGLYAFTSDVLISPVDVEGFADLIVDWLEENSVTPLLLSGLPSDVGEDEEKQLYGVGTGGADDILEQAGIDAPDRTGLIGGPTGAMMHEAADRGLDAVGLVAETNPQFPDPIAAQLLLDDGVEQIVGFDVDTEVLAEQAEQIREQKQKLAEMIQNAEQHERSQAYPEGMYQ
ncbi:MAG: PAC2 family protein [Candidatus Nanohaloarchaea archaeon]|nr:PAC2 family protein [Candidatus Nanohaloarchaea archaeon]